MLTGEMRRAHRSILALLLLPAGCLPRPMDLKTWDRPPVVRLMPEIEDLRLNLVAVLAVGVLAAAEPAPQPTGEDVRAILDRVDDLFRGTSSQGRMRMTVRAEHWTRALELQFWNMGKDRSLIEILSPRKEKGTATLRHGHDLWNHLPKVNRVIKLPSSMMSGSWMGSHFTNDDLVKESRMAEDFDFALTDVGEHPVHGPPTTEGGPLGETVARPVFEITCTPHEDAAVVWGKVVVWVDPADLLPLTIRYDDEDLQPNRTLHFWDPREVGERRLPLRMRMVPVDDPEEYTEVVYEEIEFDIEIPDDLFSIRNLQR